MNLVGCILVSPLVPPSVEGLDSVDEDPDRHEGEVGEEHLGVGGNRRVVILGVLIHTLHTTKQSGSLP